MQTALRLSPASICRTGSGRILNRLPQERSGSRSQCSNTIWLGYDYSKRLVRIQYWIERRVACVVAISHSLCPRRCCVHLPTFPTGRRGGAVVAC
jgi:hypothetical protein